MLGLAIAVVLVTAACGSDGGGSTAADTTTPSPPSTAGATPVSGELPCAGGVELATLEPAAQPLATKESVTMVAGAKVEALVVPFLADHLGEFERENLDVTFQILPPADATILIATDRADMMIGGLGAGELNAISSGVDMRWIANAHQQSPESQEGLWLRDEYFTADGKPDPAAIKGMKVALSASSAASTASVPTARWLESIGLSLADVSLVNLPATEILIALESGAIGAGYLVAPFWKTASSGDFAQLVTPTPPFAASGYLLAGDHLGEDRAVADAIVRAMSRTIEACLQGDYHADPAAVAALAEVLGQPVDVLVSTPSLVFDPQLGFNTSQLDDLQSVWLEGDVLDYDQPLADDELVDLTVVEHALSGR